MPSKLLSQPFPNAKTTTTMYEDSSDYCRICGESPTGCHYGVWCCNSCKCFFRRCVIQQGHYQCRTGNNQCEIRKESRNACRACRYAKCIAVGLKPEKMIHSDSTTAVQLPDQSGTNTPEDPVSQQCSATSNSFSQLPALAVSLGNSSYEGATDLSAYQQPNLMTPSHMAVQIEMSSSLPLGAISGLLSHQFMLNDPLSNYFILVERFCESYRDTPLSCASPHIAYNLNMPIERAFLEPRSLIPRTPIDWEARFPMTPGYHLPRQWCRAVAFYSDWASHIPELHLLDLDDRVRMLAGRVKQCNWLWVASRSIMLAAGQLVFFGAGGCYPLDSEEQARVIPEVNNLYQPLCHLLNTEIIRPALSIQVREEELALLKVLCFCSPVAGLKLSSLEIIQSAQAKYQAALVEEVMKHPAGNINRLVKIMSWLMTVERLAEEGNKHYLLMTLLNIAEMKGSLPYELHVRSE